MRTSSAFMAFLSFLLLICNTLMLNSLIVAAHEISHHRKLAAGLDVAQPPYVFSYHHGPLLVASPPSGSALTVHLIWYGTFGSAQKNTICDFLNSFASEYSEKQAASDDLAPSVRAWWKITAIYTDALDVPVASSVALGTQISDAQYSLGKMLRRTDLEMLVLRAAEYRNSNLPEDRRSKLNQLYMVLTAEDVYVDGFCRNACASHSSLATSATASKLAPSGVKTEAVEVVYAWVGNSASACAGKCAWPFANPKDFGGPDTLALISPNGDVGVDGMIINIATVLAGAATNPFLNGYFQGDAAAPLEAATACAGIFGEGAYPGYPGHLLLDPSTNASFNVRGLNGRAFLLPALWNPSTKSCSPPSDHLDGNPIEIVQITTQETLNL